MENFENGANKYKSLMGGASQRYEFWWGIQGHRVETESVYFYIHIDIYRHLPFALPLLGFVYVSYNV